MDIVEHIGNYCVPLKLTVSLGTCGLIQFTCVYFYLGVFTGCVVILALSVLTPFFQYIPKPSLAAIIIMSVLRMVDVRIAKKIWQTNRIDIIPLLVTFFVCLYEIDIGIVCGIIVALMIVLYHHFVPKIELQGQEVCVIGVHEGLTYMGIEYLISQVRQNAVLSDVKPEVVVIECAAMPECDFTVLQGISQIIQDCKGCNITVVLSNVQDNVKQMLVNGGVPLESFEDDLNEEHSCLLKPNNILL